MKKKTSISFKQLLSEFVEKSTEVLIYAMEKIDLSKVLGDIFDFKARLRTYFGIHIFATAGLIVLTLGTMSYLEMKYSFLANGIGKIIAGLILILISLMLYIINKRR